MIIKLDIKYQI